MKAIIVLIAVLFFLNFANPVSAAISITDISPTVINSRDDIISLTATASGLSSSTQYLQIVFTKEGETTDYLGLTNNQQGEWYKYKSSPSVSEDLQIYFYNFTPVGGTWTGTISAKLDTDDSGFKGQGNYIVKLAKYITSSSPTYSTNQYTLTVNITPTPTSTPTPTPTPTASPTNTPTPTKTPTPTPTKIPTPTPEPTVFPPTPENAMPTSVLAASTGNELDTASSKNDLILSQTKKPDTTFQWVSIALGIIFVSVCAILTVRVIKKGELMQNEEE